MKRLLLRYTAMSVLLIVAVLCSFGIPRRELRSTAQVAGIALDEKDGKLYAAFELYSPVLDEPIGTKRQTVSSVGDSLQECIDRAQRVGGESLFTDDASVLIIGDGNEEVMMQRVVDHYRQLKNDRMDLPLFFTADQSASKIFAGEGVVLSGELSESAKALNQVQTLRDFLNGTGQRVWITGEGNYEIIS